MPPTFKSTQPFPTRTEDQEKPYKVALYDADGNVLATVPISVSSPITVNQGTGAGASGPWSMRLSDGSAFYDAAKTGQLPTALVGGRLDTNIGAWLGSAAPSIGQKTMANSLPVVIASDQGAITVQQLTGTNLHVVVDAATIAALTDGTQKAIVRGAAKGGTPAADATVSPIDANLNGLDVNVYGSGLALPISDFGAGNAVDINIISNQAGSISVNTELPSPIALSDTAGNPTTPLIGASSLVWNSGTSQWQRVRGDTTNGMDVDITRMPDEGQQTMANSISVAIASDQSNLPINVAAWASIAVTAAAALSDSFSNPTAPPIGSFLMGWDAAGAVWKRGQLGTLFDLDTGGGTQNVIGVALRTGGSGGSVEFGTNTAPIRVDPVGTTTQPVSGTVTANQGGTWNISQITTGIVPGTSATNLGKSEDLAFANNDVGVMALYRRKDTPVANAEVSNDGDYLPALTDNTGKLWIAGSQKEDDAHATGDRGVFVLAVRNNQASPTTWADANGDYSPFSLEGDGTLWAGGNRAHDSVDAGNPIKVGGKAATSRPTAVANADRVDAWLDAIGQIYTRSDHQTRSDTFTTAANGTTVDMTANPMKYFSIQTVNTGAVTSWTIVLEGSLDGTNFFTILTATNAAPAPAPTAPAWPVRYIRSRCSTIVLGGGTNVVATILGMN